MKLRDNPHVRDAVNKIVGHLLQKDYDAMVKSRLLTQDVSAHVQDEVGHYGRTLIELPESAFTSAHEYDLGGNQYRLEIQLWTKEEGESDLTLIVEITRQEAGHFTIQVNDVHVM